MKNTIIMVLGIILLAGAAGTSDSDPTASVWKIIGLAFVGLAMFALATGGGKFVPL